MVLALTVVVPASVGTRRADVALLDHRSTDAIERPPAAMFGHGRPWLQAVAVALGTFVSEDLTCIAVGLMVRSGELPWTAGLAGCYAGIVLGDLGLWLLGFLAGALILNRKWIRRRLHGERLDVLAAWLERNGLAAVFAARFLPGLRLPTYVAAGALLRRPLRFALWAGGAALVWTPLLGAGAALLLILRLGVSLATETGRTRWLARLQRIRRWEFWPTWLFYLPIVPYLAFLAVRYRGITTPTSANPGMPHGGVVGESKHEILTRLPAEWVIPTFLVPPGPLESRLRRLGEELERRGWPFPAVLKPDASQRGAGLRLIRSAGDARRYLSRHPEPVIAQVYHPGPFEAGVFYHRLPAGGSDSLPGRIFSITDKEFPSIVGDGESSLERLVWRHPRYRLQADVFLSRLDGQASRVPALGERCALGVAGNHCQGALFRDGRHLITPELERRFDEIARSFDGFFFGRFDVRYGDVDEFLAGRGFAIVELNGVMSESTNVYDPSWPIWRAYSTLCRQWEIAFRIGDSNRRRGHAPTPLRALLAEVRRFYRDRTRDDVSD
ncbi:MAG: VTT domain-containing protein [Phycisphaerae bacterium]